MSSHQGAGFQWNGRSARRAGDSRSPGRRSLAWSALIAVAVAATACGTTSTSGADHGSTTLKSSKSSTVGHTPVPGSSGGGGSTILETVGRYRFSIRIGQSVIGSESAIQAFFHRVVTKELPATASSVLGPLPLQGSGRFVAFIAELVNTGTAPEPSNAQGVVALGNGLPLVALANPSVVGMASPGPTGLECPKDSAPSALGFGPDNSNTLCVELANAGSGPMSLSPEQPGEFAAGQSGLYVIALALSPSYPVSDIHIAVNTSSVGDEASWAESVPISGTPVTVSVHLPGGFTAGEA